MILDHVYSNDEPDPNLDESQIDTMLWVIINRVEDSHLNAGYYTNLLNSDNPKAISARSWVLSQDDSSDSDSESFPDFGSESQDQAGYDSSASTLIISGELSSIPDSSRSDIMLNEHSKADSETKYQISSRIMDNNKKPLSEINVVHQKRVFPTKEAMPGQQNKIII